MTDIGALDLRAIVKNGLQDLYVQFCMITEEHGNMTLHELSEQAGKLIARHDVINVMNFGFLLDELESFLWGEESHHEKYSENKGNNNLESSN